MNEMKKTWIEVSQIIAISVAILYFLGIMLSVGLYSGYGITEIASFSDFNTLVAQGFIAIFFTIMKKPLFSFPFILFVCGFIPFAFRRDSIRQNLLVLLPASVFVFGLITFYTGEEIAITDLQELNAFYAGTSVKIDKPYLRISYKPRGATSPATTEGFKISATGTYLLLYRDHGLFAVQNATISTIQFLSAPQRPQSQSKESNSHTGDGVTH